MFKPNGGVSSIRFIMLLLLPFEVVAFYACNYYSVRFDNNATTIAITMFSVTAALTMGPIFMEHAIDKVGQILTTIKQLKYGNGTENTKE